VREEEYAIGEGDGHTVHVIGCVRLQANYRQCKYKYRQTAETHPIKHLLPPPHDASHSCKAIWDVPFFWKVYIFISKLIAGYKSGSADRLKPKNKSIKVFTINFTNKHLRYIIRLNAKDTTKWRQAGKGRHKEVGSKNHKGMRLAFPYSGSRDTNF